MYTDTCRTWQKLQYIEPTVTHDCPSTRVHYTANECISSCMTYNTGWIQRHVMTLSEIAHINAWQPFHIILWDPRFAVEIIKKLVEVKTLQCSWYPHARWHSFHDDTLLTMTPSPHSRQFISIVRCMSSQWFNSQFNIIIQSRSTLDSCFDEQRVTIDTTWIPLNNHSTLTWTLLQIRCLYVSEHDRLHSW